MGMNRGTAEAKLVEKLGLILTRVAFGVKIVSKQHSPQFGTLPCLMFSTAYSAIHRIYTPSSLLTEKEVAR